MEEGDGIAISTRETHLNSADQPNLFSGSFIGFSLNAVPAQSGSSPRPVSPSAKNAINGGQEAKKKKRGRPRKFCAEEGVSLSLVPGSSPERTEKKRRGRPPGSGHRQLLSVCGEWICSSSGSGFTPHILTMPDGEDIFSKILWLSQQGSRAICLVSAAGAISAATLRQPDSPGGAATYEGRFEIVSLSGSFIVSEGGGDSCGRSGGLSVSFQGPYDELVGGEVSGPLVASGPVQVFLVSFIYRETKKQKREKKIPMKGKEDEVEERERDEQEDEEEH